MVLIGSDTVEYLTYSYRLAIMKGNFGAGKTSFAFRLALAMALKYKFRYIISNTLSVLTDDPADVFLREGIYADAIIILDEAGEFMESRSQTREFISFLRKINVVLIMPSFMLPSREVRLLSVQRVFNAEILALPLWAYRFTVDNGDVENSGFFAWHNPREIWGLYDTVGLPQDADEIIFYLKRWIDQARRTTGYDIKRETGKAISLPPQRFGGIQTRDPSDVGESGRYSTVSQLADARGVADDIIAASEKIARAVPVSKRRGSRGWR